MGIRRHYSCNGLNPVHEPFEMIVSLSNTLHFRASGTISGRSPGRETYNDVVAFKASTDSISFRNCLFQMSIFVAWPHL
jgi:hypothetical protein